MSVNDIARRKLLLVKQLFLQAANERATHSGTVDRIMALIGFDLTVETLLKVVFSNFETKVHPPEVFSQLLDSVDSILTKNQLPSLPYRSNILFQHSLRNDAQHKAKYPNTNDVSDCRTYTRSFCTEMFKNVWDVGFWQLSLIDNIADPLIKRLLEDAELARAKDDFLKSSAIAGATFGWASKSLFGILPSGADGANSAQIPELSYKSVAYLNIVLKSIEKSAKQFSVMVATGVSPVDYRRMLVSVPHLTYAYDADAKDGENKFNIEVRKGGKSFSAASTEWLIEFVVSTIIAWQELGIGPEIYGADDTERATALTDWDSQVVKVFE